VKGPAPKPPELRQRRNKASTAATLDVAAPRTRRPPALPRRINSDGLSCPLWHPNTVRWWRTRWRSPMAAEYLAADVDRLLLVADLIDRYWREPSVSLAAEIRQQDGQFGGTPMDRRRLDWKIARTDAVVRRQKRAAAPPPTPADDPRRGLSALAGGLA
jgi:hypothetical protein